MRKKRKKLTPEERAAWRERDAQVEARIRQLRELVERGEADMRARAAAGRPYPSPPGTPPSEP
jgi:hypothetical protein